VRIFVSLVHIFLLDREALCQERKDRSKEKKFRSEEKKQDLNTLFSKKSKSGSF
jgi:hypothetical protein